MNTPDVTVIIPTYNHGLLLQQAIDSCVTQPGVSLEVIVVDDCSTDGTRDWLAKCPPPVIPVLLDSNSGSGGRARNVGLGHARGRYVKFLDGDDVLEPGTLSREFGIAGRHDADLVMSAFKGCLIDSEGRRMPGWERTYSSPPVETLVDSILRDEVPFCSAVLYRREHLAGMQWDSRLSLQDDFDFFSRAALKAAKVVADPGFAYCWRRHANSIQRRHAGNPLGFLDAAYVQEAIYRRIENLLQEAGQLTQARRAFLAQVYYKRVRAFSRFDRAKCEEVLAHIHELDSAFQPTPQAESSRALRQSCRVLGVSTTVRWYGRFRGLADAKAKRTGWLSFRGEREPLRGERP